MRPERQAIDAGATKLATGFDGPHGRVRDRLPCEPRSGPFHLLANARRNRLKVRCWKGTGPGACAKQLERGAFRLAGATARDERAGEWCT